MINKIIPSTGKILIRLNEKEETFAGNIIIPDISEDSVQLAIVEEVKLSEEFGLLLVKGDNVLIKRDSGVSIKQFENEYKIIEENDILAKIT